MNFDYYQPTKIIFGWGKLDKIGNIVSNYGERCLLVTRKTTALLDTFENIKNNLEKANVAVYHFDKVVANPTTFSVNEGSELAIKNKIDVVLGVGGGSSIDTAKAIAVGATHPGEAWDYRLFTDKDITNKTLPIISASTTSGTGSQVTPVSVVTNSKEKSKFALVDNLLNPKASIIDPKLMITVPEHVTATTGFDVMAHAFESTIHTHSSPYIDMHAEEALKKVVKYLPIAIKNGENKEARIKMAYADTLAGLSIANSGTTLPHGIGMAIGGHAPNIMHAEALAIVYPEFMRFTYSYDIKKFAKLGRILNPDLENTSDKVAAEESCNEMDKFLKNIGMWSSLGQKNVPKEELLPIAEDSLKLPDYKVNPRVANRDDIMKILENSY